ncbi:HlyD family type I secretion periplasmic adaptor subunit [Devosia sp. Leaf64]|uniref:HlyD family type I secretion periplasmic adaptor subunit n=1 Tax=Devosia sp. Leaf64 TaxID=1736229 RepID=UPI000714F8A9|nr:HlyD family type I secretion periplasmic adaptor subunit [Devosia sp. Leaf64]KQN77509.1 hypothetical protein ASE94_16020 [Devosia sp. Leaf64]
MSEAAQNRNDLASLKLHGWIGLISIVGLFGALIAWGATTEVSGAIISHGSLMVQSSAKQVQHPEGGVISELLVQNEDKVQAGQLLASIDQTSAAAALESSDAQLRQLLVQEARLLAEASGDATFEIPESATKFFSEDDLRPVQLLEERILGARQATRKGSIAQLQEQVIQLDRQEDGLVQQQKAISDQIGILKSELADFDHLFASQLVNESRGTALHKELAVAQGQLGQITASIAEGRAASAEKTLQISQIDYEHLNVALNELAQVRRSISEVSQRRLAEQDRLKRTEIRAPQGGIIHELAIHTEGGVVQAGQTLMLVVPSDDPLIVNSRIEIVDVDKVHVGQEVVLRFSGLNPRTTPELVGSISAVAPDVTRDPATGAVFYSVRVVIADDELAKLPEDIVLVAGMPVEAYVQLADRAVLSYMFQPFWDHLRLALREE